MSRILKLSLSIVFSICVVLLLYNKYGAQLTECEIEPIRKVNVVASTATTEPSRGGATRDDKIKPYEQFLSKEVLEYTYELCQSKNANFGLVMAIIENESQFKSDAISPTNDYGLMQINKNNHTWLSEELGITDFLDSKQNIQAGVHILSLFSNKGYTEHQVLMCYNLGESGAMRKRSNGIYETGYSRKVIDIMRKRSCKDEMKMKVEV